MKIGRLISTVLFVSIISLIIVFRNDLVKLYLDILNVYEKEIKITEKNKYYRNIDFVYVQNTNNFIPENKQDILNIYYTVVNSGLEEFSFYCNDKKYATCLDDVRYIASNQITLSHINNFVHPFNSFSHIETIYDSIGNIKLQIKKNYSNKKITTIENKVQEIMNQLIKDDMNNETKIKIIHDYIINNTRYDNNRSDHNIIKYDSDTAYGPLIEGYGLCGGYSDAMMIFLISFGINNYKIASDNHVWNYIYNNNDWYHLDLTWDDPITTNGTDVLEYNFFLITTLELEEINDAQHVYDKIIYQQ